MRFSLAYDLLDDPPYIPAELLVERFEAKVGPPTAEGCRIWTGGVCLRGDHAAAVGKMRLKTPTGTMLVTAPKVAWYLDGRGWLGDDILLRRTCGQALCCAPDHLTPQAKVDRRRLTVEQVLECRQLYWGQRRRQANRYLKNPVVVASRLLGLSKDTVRRVAEGAPVLPGQWANWQLTVADVERAIEDARAIIARNRQEHADAWTQKRLGERYGVEASEVRQILAGRAYKDVGGLTSAEEGERQRLAAERALARQLRQASQGDPTIRARLAQAQAS